MRLKITCFLTALFAILVGVIMLKFIFKRLLEALPTLFILITFSFFLMRLAPGSPFTSERAYPPEVMANIEAKYH